MTHPITVHITTFGCQMNKLDSELVMDALAAEGFERTASADEARVVLFNTCSVREHAEEKVFSRLAGLKRRAEREPGLVVGVIGCMAQRQPERIFERCPWVKVVCGPTELRELPRLIRQALAGYERVLAVSADIRRPAPRWNPPRSGPGTAQRFVQIMRGCNNFCAYCIVPYVRGPEVCRPLDEIVDEVRGLAENGCKEVTLLGQNVNSYRWPPKKGSDPFTSGGPTPFSELRLPDLLERVNAIDGLVRIRFLTNHPRDLSDDILDAMAGLEKVCEHLHLPAQAGSDAELARMNRGYTRAHYLGVVERARRRMPEIGLMSDFIVGFPGETAAEFAATRSLVEEVRYKNCFVFRYSPRPGTAAAGMPDDVPPEVKQDRLAQLLDLQAQIATADNRRIIGRSVEVLVEGLSKAARKRVRGNAECGVRNAELRDESAGATSGPQSAIRNPQSAIQLVGRTRSDHIVVFDGPRSLAGSLATIRITDSTDLTLFGKLGQS